MVYRVMDAWATLSIWVMKMVDFGADMDREDTSSSFMMRRPKFSSSAAQALTVIISGWNFSMVFCTSGYHMVSPVM